MLILAFEAYCASTQIIRNRYLFLLHFFTIFGIQLKKRVVYNYRYVDTFHTEHSKNEK